MDFSNLKSMVVVLVGFLLPIAVFAQGGRPAIGIQYYGINLPQASFAPKKIPGIPEKDYKWPTIQDINLYADLGMNVIRVAFVWERMQPQLYGSLVASELKSLDAIVDHAERISVTVVLDVHNYGYFQGQVVGDAAVSADALADLWRRLAERYRSRPKVAFGIMNEPSRQDAAKWVEIQQKSIDAIRRAGARQLILVTGTNYSGAHSWFKKKGEMSNAEALIKVKDPASNYMVEVHQYFDIDSSGTRPECVSASVGVERLKAFTEWLRQTGKRGFLGEFGASKHPTCIAALRETMRYLNSNKDVWGGWTYWAAAAWFGDYIFNVYPPDPVKYPQIPVLVEAVRLHRSNID